MTIAFRADIDALPMQEESAETFTSKNDGIAHTCGHDAHTAILLGFAQLLCKHTEEFSGTVKLIFQEAEELLCGAKKVIAAKGMDGVDMIFSLHCLNAFDVGTISVTSGYQLTGSDSIDLKWTGVSGHGSQPHLSNDSILAASKFVCSLSDIVVKNVSPLDTTALSVGTFHAGHASNIIAKYCDVGLTFRYFDTNVQQAIHKAIHDTAQGIAMMYDLDVEVTITQNVKPLCNDLKAVNIINDSFMKLNGDTNIAKYKPLMSS